MTDLSTSNLKRLLAEVTPGPWNHDNEVGEILGAYYEKNGIGYIPTVGYADDYNADLIALAPQLAQEVLRMREELIAWADDEARAKRTNDGYRMTQKLHIGRKDLVGVAMLLLAHAERLGE